MTAQELNTEFVEVKDAAYRYACSLLHNGEEAEDLVQDLYEKLWRRRLLVRHKGFVRLVMVSVRNMCMDILRRQKSEREKVIFADHGNYSEKGGDADGENCREEEFLWEDEKDREDMAGLVEKLIAGLPQREREAVHLRLVEELDYTMIADIMGISENAVRMAFSRGKSKVKEQLIKIMDYGVERQ